MQHNHSIDIIKGWGILAVILGHVLLGTISENILRYVIYSFHMPLFFFVSGYLLNIDKLGSLSLKQYVSKYAKRMLGWWLLAWIVYTSLSLATKEFTIVSLAKNIVFPFYHLWFVPSLFLVITLTYMAKRYLRLAQSQVLAALVVVSLFQMILWHTSFIPNESVIRYHNYLFFVVGILCKSLNYNKLIRGGYYTLLYLAALLLTKYLAADAHRSMCNFASLMATLILVLAPTMQHDAIKPSPLLEWLGRNSLQIYLWHVLPILAIGKLFDDNPYIYYTLCAATLAAFMAVVKWRIKKTSSNVYI